MFLNIKKITLPNAHFFSAASMTFTARMSCVQWTFVLRQEKKSQFFLSLPSDIHVYT